MISSLLLLLVVTILAISMFRSFGIQERIAGNVRDKQHAFQAAASTQIYAEWWLANQSFAPRAVGMGSAGLAAKTCAPNSFVDANLTAGLTAGLICNNTLLSLGVIATAWPNASTSLNDTGLGVAYTPPCISVQNPLAVTGTAGCPAATDQYFARPRFYIADVGPVAAASGEVYKIDAYSYGLSATAVAVIESTVSITCTVCNLAGL